MDKVLKSSDHIKHGYSRKDLKSVRILFTVLVTYLSALLSGCGTASNNTIPVPKGAIDPPGSFPTNEGTFYTNKPFNQNASYQSGWPPDMGSYEGMSVVDMQVKADSNSGDAPTTILMLPQSKDDEKNRNHPFELKITPSQEGVYNVKIQGRECIVNTTQCSEWSDMQFNLVFDQTPPKILSIQSPESATESTVTGMVSDNLSGVSKVSLSSLDGKSSVDGSFQDGNFSVGYRPVPGNNSFLLKVDDKAGNETTKQVEQNYDLSADLKVDTIQDGNKLIVYGNLPKTVDEKSLVISGKQPLWKFFGFQGSFSCDNLGGKGVYDYVFSCQMPEKDGDPVKIHVNFKDQFGNVYDVSYTDKSDFYANIAQASTQEKFIWFTEFFLAATASITALGLAGYTIEKAAKSRVENIEKESALAAKREELETAISRLCYEEKFGAALVAISKFPDAGNYKKHLETWVREQEYKRKKYILKEIFIDGYQTIISQPDFEKKLVNGMDDINFLMKSDQAQVAGEAYDISEIFRHYSAILNYWVNQTFFSEGKQKNMRYQSSLPNWSNAEPLLKKIVESQVSQKYSYFKNQFEKEREELEKIVPGLPERLNEISIIYAAFTGQLLKPEYFKVLAGQYGITDLINILAEWKQFDTIRFLTANKSTSRTFMSGTEVALSIKMK